MVLPLFATCTWRHVAPGAETIRKLCGGEPALIMSDEVSVYLRKVKIQIGA
jgi:hypothetical protein